MADPGFEAFLWALTQQESGGNYRAVGPPTPYGRAYGRYQVLEPNVGKWTAQYYGRRLTPQQFLYNNAAQDAVVRGVLGSYYKRYGARGAAAMWYSGQSNPNKSYGNPPVYQYVNSVMSRAGRYTGQSVGGASGATYSIGTAVPNLSLADMAARFGLSAATVKANKEIANLVKKAVKEGWDGALFTAKLKNTKWWRTTSDAQRKYFLLRTSDPATYKQKYNQYAFSLNQLAVQVGMKTQMVNGKPTSLLNKAIAYKMRDGWTDARIKAYFGSQVTLIDKNGGMRGEAGEIYDQIFEAAYGNGMIWSPSWFQAEVRRIVSGKATLETSLAVIRREAAAKYSAFANQIRAGQSALDLAQPYIQSVAQLLELPVTDIDLNNKFVNKAMTAKAKAGKPGTQYPLWQFENDVRSDPLWKKTNNARESMFSVAHQVARDFGLAF